MLFCHTLRFLGHNNGKAINEASLNNKQVFQMNFQIKHLVILSLLSTLGACSPATYSKTEVVSSSIGGLAGGYLGHSQFSDVLGTVVGGAAGALGGLVVGGHLEKKRVEEARAAKDPKRIPITKKNPKDCAIEDAWLEMERSSKLGASETKSWNERYLDHESHLPYQGH